MKACIADHVVDQVSKAEQKNTERGYSTTRKIYEKAGYGAGCKIGKYYFRVMHRQ